VISKRGKRWRVVVQAPRDPLTGSRRQLSGSAATEREAVKLERQLWIEAEGGVVGSLTLARLVEEWWRSLPRLAATTQANYRLNLQNHILPLLGDKKVSEIRPRLVSAFLRHLGDEKAISPATVRKVRTVLSAVMSFAVSMEYADSNPVMKVPPPEQAGGGRVAPTIEETARILLAAEEADPEFLAYLWLAAEEGGRRGETLALRWTDVDFNAGTVTIQRVISIGDDGVQVRVATKTKTNRTVAVSPVTLGHLRAHRGRVEGVLSDVEGCTVTVSPESLVFSGGSGSRRTPLDGKPWRPDSTSRRFRLLKERAGVRGEVDLHGLRHTMITELLASGVDPRTVMGRAGHSSEATTMTVYAKVRPAVDSAAAELWGRLLDEKLAELAWCTSSRVAVSGQRMSRYGGPSASSEGWFVAGAKDPPHDDASGAVRGCVGRV
jgi:integrase